MSFPSNLRLTLLLVLGIGFLAGCQGLKSPGTTTTPPQTYVLSVTAPPSGAGTITSTPAGINCPTTCSASFAEGTAVALTATPAANYYFASWSGGCSGTGACSVTTGTSVSATFNPGLTVTEAGTGTVTSSPAGINCPTTCSTGFAPNTQVTLTATPGANNTFTGWSGGGCSGTSTCTVTLAAASSVTATFNPVDSLSVTVAGTGIVTSNPAGINCPTTCSANYAANTQVTLTATAGTNYTFTGWSGACSGTTTCTVTLAAATSVTATFSPAQNLPVTVTVTGTGTVTSSPAGINCPTTCSASFAPNTQVSLAATPGTNNYFTGWSGACSGTGACTVTLTAATNIGASFNPGGTLTVALAGAGTGTVTSTPAGINCSASSTACSAIFPQNTQVTLSATPASGDGFSGWLGACTGSSVCTLTVTAAPSVTATFVVGGNLQSLNHIIVFAQENRSFDSYFGSLRAYWAQAGIADQSFDGLPQFNPASGAAPLQGPAPALPGCTSSSGTDCQWVDGQNLVTSFPMQSVCQELMSPFWNEGHRDWDIDNPTGINSSGAFSPAVNNGFVVTAADDARQAGTPINDVNGLRAMGYFDWNDLNFYYNMASNFATSDRWFSPVIDRTQLNRMYMIAGTSAGQVYPEGSGNPAQSQLNTMTIFQELQNAGITWKIYVDSTTCPGLSGDALSKCLIEIAYINQFIYEDTIINTEGQTPDLLQNIQPISQFAIDAANGTLPQFAMIDPPSDSGNDEHPSDFDDSPVNIQNGASYVESQIINPFMQSQSWKDSALIFTYDESGGFYDHVAPQPVPAPDSILPTGFYATDICNDPYVVPNGICNFQFTGYRIPMIVISPFARKNYVSHVVRDYTAVLNLVEERFNVAALTARDAYWSTSQSGSNGFANAQMDEFFDFVNVPWATPPTPPTQVMNGTCSLAAPSGAPPAGSASSRKH